MRYRAFPPEIQKDILSIFSDCVKCYASGQMSADIGYEPLTSDEERRLREKLQDIKIAKDKDAKTKELAKYLIQSYNELLNTESN